VRYQAAPDRKPPPGDGSVGFDLQILHQPVVSESGITFARDDKPSFSGALRQLDRNAELPDFRVHIRIERFLRIS
jgi:hypothetical protein